MADNHDGTDAKQVLKKEIDQLSDAHAEQVMQHVRELRQVPESAEKVGDRNPNQLDVNQRDANLVWYCGRCEKEFPRPLSDPGQCPGCGAPREELVLQEASHTRAA